MPRHLTSDEGERLGRLAQEWDRLYVLVRGASVTERLEAFKQLEKRFLKEMRTAAGKREVQRRLTRTLLMETREGPWRRFSPYLRRMERLGYASMDDRLLVCGWAAQAAKGSPTGSRKAIALITDFERRARLQLPHPAAREQVEASLARARSLIGLSTDAVADEREGRRKARV